MQKVLFTQGLPSAGKSTWARAYCEKHTDWVRVCRDDLRNMRGKYWLPKQENLITEMENYCIMVALNRGYNVIVDATHLNQKDVVRKTRVIKDHYRTRGINVEFEIKSFDLSIEKCIERDLKRVNSVGEKVIRKFYDLYLRQEKLKVKQDESLSRVILIDLDGTIALHNGRSPYEYEKCDTDLPNFPVIKVIENYLSYGCGDIIFMSGREDSCKEKTLQWIQDNIQIMPGEIQLYMRKTGDRRKDAIIKRELFEKHIKNNYYIDFVIDDRPQVIRMWKDLGLFVFNVGDGIEF